MNAWTGAQGAAGVDSNMVTKQLRDLIEAIREKVDISAVIGRCVQLDRHGRGLCPFHQEKTPSFFVHCNGRYFHCFGCGVGGDVFRFLELYEHKSFWEALSELAGEAGVSLCPFTSDHRGQIEEERLIEDVLTATADFYHRPLTAEARRYLTEERGFTDDTIRRFKIGYAGGGLKEHLIQDLKFSEEICLTAGVLKQGEGKPARDFFSRRIIFPNIRHGRVVHLSGRSLDGREPKYLHLPGEIRYLFNEDALFADEVLITESPTDCIFAEQQGYRAVALLGKSLKAEHAAKFSRCRVIYLCLDGDDAGIAGARKVGKIIGERAKVIHLPDGLDLDEYLRKHGKTAFDALKKDAPDIFKFELRLIPADTPKTELPRVLEPLLKSLAQLEGVHAEAYLTHEIKPRFSLTNREINGYRKSISKFRGTGAPASGSDTAHANNGPGRSGPYRIEAGRICVERMTRLGAVTVPLCNFIARVTEELVLDDGVETTRSFAIEGELEDGTRLPLVRVPTAQFNGMAWVTQNWGRSAIVNAGSPVRDQVREAIQRLSPSAQQRRVFTHTGWREVDGKWLYLAANGALGCEEIEVDLGSGLSCYRLPKKPEDVVGAVRASLQLLELGPLTVTVPLFAGVYRAPLAAAFPLDFSLWLEGITGSLKSTLAALFLCHFGEFDRIHLPGTWASTANCLEHRAFTLKDVPFVVDDYAPCGLDARELEIKAARLLRAQGNLQGRGRLRADLTERPDYTPRGLIISTGEQHPTGQSILARTPIIEVQRSSIRLAALSEAQKNAGRLAHAMSGYIGWLAPQMRSLSALLRETFEGTRQRATKEGEHLRIPEALAHLWLGAHCGLSYAEEVGACAHAEAEDYRAQVWEALLSLGGTEGHLIESERPSRRFLGVLHTLLTQGRVRLLPRGEGARDAQSETPFIGWVDSESLCLVPDAAFQAVARFCRDTGEWFPVRQVRLMKDLAEEGLSECDPGRHTTTVNIGGRTHRVVRLRRKAVEALLGMEFPGGVTQVTGVTGFED